MKKFMILADVAAPSAANALNTVAVAAITHISAQRLSNVPKFQKQHRAAKKKKEKF